MGAFASDSNGAFAGQTRVFVWDGSQWTQWGQALDGEAPGDQFGSSVALSANGNNLAVGAPYNDGSGPDAGHVRVYVFDGSQWTKRGQNVDGRAAGDEFGWRVAMSADGNMIAVGYPDGSDSGSVHVFLFDGSAWMQRGQCLFGEIPGDGFGGSVALSSDGNVIAVGANQNDGNGDNPGHAQVFEWR